MEKTNTTGPTIDDDTHNESQIILGLLTAISRDSSVTQRSVARELGIALGLANAYLKRCVKKGLVKVNQIPANRYAYYLTPRGFSEKSRLTAQYFKISFDFFRRARSQCADILRTCESRGWRRVALVGVSDLAEIATLCARDGELELVAIVDPDADESSFAGLAVFRSFESLDDIDAWLVSDLSEPQSVYEWAAARVPEERLFAPDLLNINPDLTSGDG